jgi:hypothetical protein
MRTAQKFLMYVDWVGEGDTTRLQAAEHFAVSKSTATYHLERAVSEGMLERFYSWTDEYQTGWAYRKPGGNEEMPFEGMAESHPPDLLDQLFKEGTSALDLDTWDEYPDLAQWPSEQTGISQWEYDVEAAQNHGDLLDM